MPFAMGFKNDIQSIAARQISIIAGIKQDVFVCVTVTGTMLDKYNGRYSAGDYQTYLRNHQAAIWHIPFNNLFQGPYEAFNGPNAIDITSAH